MVVGRAMRGLKSGKYFAKRIAERYEPLVASSELHGLRRGSSDDTHCATRRLVGSNAIPTTVIAGAGLQVEQDHIGRDPEKDRS